MTRSGILGGPQRALGPGERLGVAVAGAALLHLALYLFLELAVRVDWPGPQTYLGSVTVELDGIPAPVPAPAAEPRRSVTPTTPTPRTVSPAAPVVAPPAPSTSTVRTEPQAAQPMSVGAPAPVGRDPASSGAPLRRDPASSGASPGPAATGEPATPAPVETASLPTESAPSSIVPAEVLQTPEDILAALLPRRTILPTPTSPTESGGPARVGGQQRAATGSAVRPQDSTPTLEEQIAHLGTGGATPPERVAGTSGTPLGREPLSGATGLPLEDPLGRYSIQAGDLQRGSRGLLTHVEPDLAGLAVGSELRVVVRIMVPASGLVMTPELVRRGTPEIDAAILAAIRRWMFTPAPGAPAVEATVTFTIRPTR